MSTVADKTLVSPETFLRMSDQKQFELIDGELVEQKLSTLSSWVGGEVFGRIRGFCVDRELGWVFPADNGFQCFPDRPTTVRRPDVSFVKAGRMSWNHLTDGWLRVIPDLIVEVVSPHDKFYEVEEKIEMFLKAGVSLIWVINPDVRTVRVIRADGSTAMIREGGDLSGEDVLPGFICPMASIFPPATPTPEPSHP